MEQTRGKMTLKFCSIMITLFIVLQNMMLFTVCSAQENLEETYVISVLLDGVNIEFDVSPQIINNRTMVPMRAIFEKLGATVEWNGETRTVTSKKGDTTIILTIDDTNMYVNDEVVVLDSPACLIDSRTLVPVRAVSEAFDLNVDWDGDTKTVVINSTLVDSIDPVLAYDDDRLFHDEAFEYSVRRAIALELDYKHGTIYDGELTEELLDRVISLYLYDAPNGKKLTSISDIDKLRNLRHLRCKNVIDNIEDWEVISDSEVEFCDFAFELCVRMSRLPNGGGYEIYIGKISNEMLYKITEISTVCLPENVKLESLEDLRLVPNLTGLTLTPQNTRIKDFSQITGLENLEILILSGIEIEDDSFLYNLNLRFEIGFPNFGINESGMYLYLSDKLDYQKALNSYKIVKEKYKFLESEISKADSDYTKYKIIHDYLVDNMDYDYDYVITSFENDIVDDIYLGLYEGKGICEIYARCYQYLCNYFGLDCWLVYGESKGVIYPGDIPQWLDHMWNIVLIDDNFYHVDVTWDDPLGDRILRHDYFLVSDDKISNSHRWNDEDYRDKMIGVGWEELEIPLCLNDYIK